MPTRDAIHGAVRNALHKDGWTITADPFTLPFHDATLFADLAAERTLAAVRGDEKIAVEIKSFSGPSPIHELELALGQFELYRGILEECEPGRKLVLAITDTIYGDLFQRPSFQWAVERFQLSLLIVNLESEEVVQWIS